MQEHSPEHSFWNVGHRHPERVAVVEPDGSEHTFAAVLAQANQIVHSLRALGLQRGDAVAVLSENRVEFLAVTLAALQAGMYLTPLNWHLAAPEIAYIIEDSGAKALFASARFSANAIKAADAVAFPATARFAFGTIAGFQSLAALTAGQPTDDPADRIAGAVMTYTSGTTGKPKGVKRPIHSLSPEFVYNQMAQFLMLFGIMPGGDNTHLTVAPLYHTAVMNFTLNSLHFGHTVVLMDRWTAADCLRLIERYKITHSHMVPTMFNRMLQLPDAERARYDVGSMRCAIHSAAPCPVQTKQQMLAWWGPVIYEYYAATEGGGTLATPQDWLKKPGTVGNAWPISQIKIVDDDGNELPAGEVGTVYMSMGEHRFEYHGDQDKTKRAWMGSFFTVGDAGYLDEDGFLFLCDRKSDMIIAGGVNIYPAEIEGELVQHPAVGDVAVFGIPNDDLGEEIKAVVELRAGVEADDALKDEILAFLGERIAKYKLPRTIDFTDALPREANGKLLKRKLRDPYWAGRDRAI